MGLGEGLAPGAGDDSVKHFFDGFNDAPPDDGDGDDRDGSEGMRADGYGVSDIPPGEHPDDPDYKGPRHARGFFFFFSIMPVP